VLYIRVSGSLNSAWAKSYVSDIKAACFPCSTNVGATFGRDHAFRLGHQMANLYTQSQDFRYGAIPTMSAEVHLYPRGLYQVVCTPILDGLHTSLLLVIQATAALD
jgi:hypothetical protein